MTEQSVSMTQVQVRLMGRLLKVVTEDQLDRLLLAMEEIASNGQGLVTLKIYRGHLRFIERTFTDDMRE